MRQILTICHTRQRVEKCANQLQSFLATSSLSSILYVIDDDDPANEQYRVLFDSTLDDRVQFYSLPRMNITRIFNGTFHNYPNYQYYHLTNDDFVYQTKGWDNIMLGKLKQNGYGIASANDLIHKDPLPVAPLISGNIVRGVGWLQLPSLHHLSGDMVWKVIAEKLDCYFHFKDVIIEHRHCLKNKDFSDEISDHTNSKEMFNKDHRAFREWLASDVFDDVKKIKKFLNLD